MANEERNLSHAAPESVEELEALKTWWNAHGDKVTMGLIAVLVVVIGFQQYTRWHGKTNARAMAAFDSARTPEALEQLINDNASKTITPLARLRLANIYFGEQNYTLAQSAYEAFLAENANHPLADIATVGLAHSLEANGKVEEAAAKFKAFSEAKPDSFLVPIAQIGLGRCLILAGHRDEGKGVLDLFITEKAGTRWASYADEILRAKDRLTIPAASASTDLSSFFSVEESATGAPAAMDAPAETVEPTPAVETAEAIDAPTEAVEPTPAVETAEAPEPEASTTDADAK